MGAGVTVDHTGDVLRLTLARPERRNALDHAAMDVLLGAVTAAATDDALRVVVLQADGPVFCAGVDLIDANRPREARLRTGHVARETIATPHRLVEAIWDLPLPVVAAVRGHASGLGCGLALAADFAIVSTTARFSMPMVRRGFTPDSSTTWLLPRLVGVARAKRLLLLGREVDGSTAAAWGMVERVVADDELEVETEALVAELASAATVAVGLAKWAVHTALSTDLHRAVATEAVVEEVVMRSPDFKEGIAAFREKRPPSYEGR